MEARSAGVRDRISIDPIGSASEIRPCLVTAKKKNRWNLTNLKYEMKSIYKTFYMDGL